MKRCPECRRDYYDDRLLYCLEDGTALLQGSVPPPDEPATAILSEPQTGDPAAAPASGVTSSAGGQFVENPTQTFVHTTDQTAIFRPGTEAEHRESLGDLTERQSLSAHRAAKPQDVSPSIAVLPFASMSPDAENEYFCDGLAEDLLNALAKINDLKVAARTSAFSFKGKNANATDIGKALNVNTILEGSVRRSGDRLRITVQLINAADGYHLWSERYDRTMRDIFDVQDEITLAVVDALKVSLLGEVPQTAPPTSDTAAYELYLKGRTLLYQRGLSIPKAVVCFRQAVDLDPDYAQAWAGLADGYTTTGYSGVQRATEVMPLALDAARRSIDLDPRLAEGHNALACSALLYDLDYDLAEQEFVHALELNPNYLQARAWYGLFYFQWISGRHADGFEQIQMMLNADPLSSYANTIASFSCTTSNRIPEAVEYGKRGSELDPKSYLAAWGYSVALNCDKQYESAVVVAERALAMSGRHAWAMMALASAYAGWDKMTEAQAVFRELEARSLREYVQPAILCPTAAVVGEIDKAVEFARQGIEVRDPLFVMLARTWPDYDSIRDDPRFKDLLKRMNLPE